MLLYAEMNLVKIAEKSAGKNKNPRDGFYRSAAGLEYFIKQPTDRKELFTELFAGILLKELKQHRCIEQQYWDSLIVADLIQFEDGSYGLIQPKVQITEAFKIIGSGYTDGSDRNPYIETLYGRDYYARLVHGRYLGLSVALMFSLLFSAYSVHSANIVVLDKESGSVEADEFELVDSLNHYARIDWGDAFRHFADARNNQDILKPAEYQGMFNMKSFSKGYIDNYTSMPGFLTAVAKKAEDLKKEIQNNWSLYDLVCTALQQIPGDLIDENTKKELAEYLAIPSFATISFGKTEDDTHIAKLFAETLQFRLDQIGQLKIVDQAPHSDGLYQSVMPAVPEPILLIQDKQVFFADLLESWYQQCVEAHLCGLDLRQIDLSALIAQYNNYVDAITRQAEELQIWGRNLSGVNILAAEYSGESKMEFGHAFVAHYREGAILQRLLKLDPKNGHASRFRPYEEPAKRYTEKYPDSIWSKIQHMFTLGTAIINELSVASRLQQLGESFEVERIQEYLEQFVQMRERCRGSFCSSGALSSSFESTCFYPIDDLALRGMSGEQLLTIMLEEAAMEEPSPLLIRILKENALAEKMRNAFAEHKDELDRRNDDIAVKESRVKQWESQFDSFIEAINCFTQEHISLQEKERHIERLDTMWTSAAPSLQTAWRPFHQSALDSLAQLRNQRKAYIDSLQTSTLVAAHNDYIKLPLSLHAECGQPLLQLTHQCWAACPKIADKVEVFTQLQQLWKMLPEDLPGKEQIDYLQLQVQNALHQRLVLALKQDKILENALSIIGEKIYSQELVDDLLTLQRFYYEKREHVAYGAQYLQSLDAFYERALDIRLSAMLPQQQSEALITASRQCFTHRHSRQRLLADVLMVIGFLFGGCIVGAVRLGMGKTFFFSTMETDTQAQFRKQWLLPVSAHEEQNTEVHLIGSPLAPG